MTAKPRPGDRHAVPAVSIRLSAEVDKLLEQYARDLGCLRDGEPDRRRIMTEMVVGRLTYDPQECQHDFWPLAAREAPDAPGLSEVKIGCLNCTELRVIRVSRLEPDTGTERERTSSTAT
jgi:hypothetical protein